MQIPPPLAALSIIIPTLNAARTLPACLYSLTEATEAEVIVVDGGSADETLELAQWHGARVMLACKGRGPQLSAGANAASRAWLLFLHADTVLEPGWSAEVAERLIIADRRGSAGVFQFRLANRDWRAGVLEQIVGLRAGVFGLPYGDQGLVIHRTLYHAVGGYAELPLMEDVDLIRRLGRRRLIRMDAAAVTSAQRWERDGWLRRCLRNSACLAMYRAGVPVERIARLYDR